MSSNTIKVKAKVLEQFKGNKFKLILENGKEATGVLSGKMRMNRIRIIPGDTVDVELSVYDLTLGRIAFRHK